MRRLCLGCVLIAAAALVPSLSAAGVRIELKNGSVMSADECRESDGRLICYRMGGTFELEKRDIASVKQTKGEPASAEEEQTPEEKTGDIGKKNDKSAASRDPVTEGNAKLERITRRKRELQPEREKLMNERERLNEDLKKAPDWMTVDRFAELKKRITALDEQIKAFNDEVTRLNEEEKTIIESLKKGSSAPQ